MPDWVVQVIVGLASFIGGGFLGHWLTLKAQKQHIRAEYIISNIEKTYVPILKEIQRITDNYRDFFGKHFTYGHYTIATTQPEKYAFSAIRKEGYFDIITAYNKKLADAIIHFYDDIEPKLRETELVNQEIDRAIIKAWQELINTRHANIMKGLTLTDLGERLLQENKQVLYNGPDDRWHISYHSEYDQGILDECKEEFKRLAEPHMQRLHEKHKEGLELLRKESVDKLMEDLRYAIGNPI